MRVLFIGGTGTISTEISRLCVARGWDLTLLNRGHAGERVPAGANVLIGDIHDEGGTAKLLEGRTFDVVADFIAFTPEDVERDIRLFGEKTAQYIFISSASAYQKPLGSPWITEGTPLHNPYWAYSRNKAACEAVLRSAYDGRGFPVTIVRPSHTYCERSIPAAIHGPKGSWSVIRRIMAGKKVIIPGDGTTLWTLTHSRDFAVAFAGLMGNTHAIGDVYHITGEESLTWNQIYECIGRALGREVHAVHIPSETLGVLYPDMVGALTGDKSNTVLFDNTKIRRAVPEFVQKIRFDEGVRDALKYIESHPECQTEDPAFDAWTDALIAAYEKAVAGFPRFE